MNGFLQSLNFATAACIIPAQKTLAVQNYQAVPALQAHACTWPPQCSRRQRSQQSTATQIPLCARRKQADGDPCCWPCTSQPRSPHAWQPAAILAWRPTPGCLGGWLAGGCSMRSTAHDCGLRLTNPAALCCHGAGDVMPASSSRNVNLSCPWLSCVPALTAWTRASAAAWRWTPGAHRRGRRRCAACGPAPTAAPGASRCPRLRRRTPVWLHL